MKLALTLITAAALVAPAYAQLGLPQLPSLPRMPRLVEGALQPLPELLGSTVERVDQRLATVRGLLDRHRDLIEADPAGAPVRRAELVLVSPDEEVLARAARLGMAVLREESWPELGLREVVLRVPPGTDTAAALRRLRAEQPGLQADFNHLYLPGGSVSGMPQPALAGPTQPAAPSDAPTRLRIGLVDAGVDRRHAALRRTGGGSFGCDGRALPSDHGTAVASLLVGRDRGFDGAASLAELFAADVYCEQPDGGSAEAVVRALAWLARERVAVVNVSLVGPDNALLARGVQALVQRGHLVVAAVGNDGPAAPALFPASYPGVVGVTAVSPARQVLPEAAQGPQVMFAAPGSDMAAARRGEGYGVVRGTSFAAPLVAGMLAAQLRTPDPAVAARALQALASGARDVGAPGRDPVYGFGLVGEALRVSPGALQSRSWR